MPNTAAELTWAKADLDDPRERAQLDRHERAKAKRRAREAFRLLRERGILDGAGQLTGRELPADMRPGSERDFGG